MTDPVANTDALPVSECSALLRQGVIGRLAVAGALGGPVGFEVDGYDVKDTSAWSVVIHGEADEIQDIDESIAAMSLSIFPWQDGVKPRYVRIVPSATTGRRIHVRVSRPAQQQPATHDPAEQA